MDKTEEALRAKLKVWEEYARTRYYIDWAGGQENYWNYYVRACKEILGEPLDEPAAAPTTVYADVFPTSVLTTLEGLYSQSLQSRRGR